MRFRFRLALVGLAGLAGLLLFAPLLVHAQALNNCSGSATNASAAIVFPTSGSSGPNQPFDYLEISNPHATAILYVNPFGGTAAATTAGSVAIPPTTTTGIGRIVWSGGTVPKSLTIISTVNPSPYTCLYR